MLSALGRLKKFEYVRTWMAYFPKNGSEHLIIHLGDCHSNFHQKECDELVRLSIFGAFFICNMVLNQTQCNKHTWLLTVEKILLSECPETWKLKDYL